MDLTPSKIAVTEPVLRRRYLVEVDHAADSSGFANDFWPALTSSPGVQDARLITYGRAVNVTPPTLNKPELIELAVWLGGEHAKSCLGLDSEWDQGNWLALKYGDGGTICGTTACAAGHVALAHGARFTAYKGADVIPLDSLEPVINGEVSFNQGLIVTPEGDERSVSEYAQEILGLDDDQAERLFSGGNDFEDMMDVISKLLTEADPPDFKWVPNPGISDEKRDSLHPGWRVSDAQRRCVFCFQDA